MGLCLEALGDPAPSRLPNPARAGLQVSEAEKAAPASAGDVGKADFLENPESFKLSDWVPG